MATLIEHWIDGALVAGTSGRMSPVFNPATGEQTGEVQLARNAEIDAAVAGAVSAAHGWRRTSLSKRSAVLFAFRELLHQRQDELAAIVTAEHGKVTSDALGEIARGLENVEFATGVPNLMKGGFSEQAATDVDVYSDSATAWCCCGHHALQLPGDGPVVDVCERDCDRQCLHSQAE